MILTDKNYKWHIFCNLVYINALYAIETEWRKSMRSASTFAKLVLGIWLLLWGLSHVLSVPIPFSDVVLGTLALIAGLLTLLGL